MKPTKKTLEAIKVVEKKVAKVCDAKKTVDVTINDNGVIVNKETGEPHFQKSREIGVALSFGTSAPKIKHQLEKQGYMLPKDFLEGAETVRIDLLSLNDVGILNNKQLFKCFKKLGKKISAIVAKSELKDGEIARHIKTSKI